jgi:hypothetical protein
MKLKTEFLCDECNEPVSIDQGYVIWDESDELVQLFVIHQGKCDPGDRVFPCSWSLRYFLDTYGLRNYFNHLLWIQSIHSDIVKEKPRRFYFGRLPGTLEEYLLQFEVDEVARVAYLKQSIAEAVGRFFDDFNPDEYFMKSDELTEMISQEAAEAGVELDGSIDACWSR